jgi:glycosyltransferase involved in cell wall biosynthesis
MIEKSAAEPAISILMPARDGAATVEEALHSLAAQTEGDWELIVVDDGSRDATPSILAAWAARDSRLRVLRHEEGRGIVAALTTALAAARGGIVARMDADDVALPERLARQRALLLSDDRLGVVGCRVRYFPEEAVGQGARRYEEWLNGLVTPEEHARDIFVECPLAHPTFMMRREALHAAGGYRAPGWPEDYDLLLRFWRADFRIAKVPEVLLFWRESPERASRVHRDYTPEAFRRCKVHYLEQSYLAGGKPALVWGAGRVGKLFARELLAAGTPLAGFVELDPRKIGQRIYDAPVLSLREALTRRGEAFGLAGVGQAGAREEIRAALTAAGWIEGVDFCCVA